MRKFVQVTLAPSNQVIQVPFGSDLKDVLHEFGVEFPCGGKGRCGACRIKVVQGKLPLSQACASTLPKADTDAGWRFACRHIAEQDLTFELGQREALVLTEHGDFPIQVGEGSAVVVDLGTTTLVTQLLDLQSGQVLAVETALNPQAVHGTDLMTRVEFSLRETGRETLTRAIRNKLGEMIQKLIHNAPAGTPSPTRVLIAGNTAMHHFFCGIDTTSLAKPPFESQQLSMQTFDAQELGWQVPGNPSVVFLPCLGSFVGSDILAGILATRMHESEELIGLADLGTNGEIVIGNRHGIVCTSTAAGPAFEAGGIEMGMRASNGAIVEVMGVHKGVQCRVLGGGDAIGICGSGLVDAVATGLILGLIEPSGRLQKDHRPFELTSQVSISQHDIRQLQLAKGAIAAGIFILLKQLGAQLSDLRVFFLAGAFGNYVKDESARRIGLIPFPKEKIQSAGNTSLHGLKTVLFSDALSSLDSVVARVQHVSLASDDSFQDIFVRQTSFPKSNMDEE